MSIDAATLNTGATSVSPTGGTASAISLIGGAKPGSALAAFDADTTKVSRRTALFTPVPAPIAKSSATGYGKERRYVTLNIPVEVSTGVWENEVLKIELASPVTRTSAQITDTCFLGAQLLSNTAFTSFWTLGVTG